MASPKKYLVLAKIESVQFTDAAPTKALNAILAKNMTVTPLSVQTEDRNLLRPYFGNSEKILVGEEAVVEFDVEMAGSGTAGTAPAYGPLLRGCAFSETINAGTDVTYAPVSAGFEYLTIWVYRDGVIYKMTGAAGTMSINMAAKKLPHYHFRFVGKYTPVTDGATPTDAVFTGFTTPLASIPAWTGTLTIGGFAAKVAAFSVDMANEISHALWMNAETLAPTDRKPAGSLTVEAVTVASNDYFSHLRNAAPKAFTLTHGTTAGAKVTIAAPAVTYSGLSETTYENTLAYQLPMVFNPSVGDDEITIKVW